ncbi:MAG: enoyl-CoA hydratase/isomerase family protein [Gammaproteobacteria bacterium]|uniref:enoyl-CoA hydratase/isomerase family protein n=1 Tax=Bradyrhizobium sp. TaxID=376 RepID=UPI003D0AB41D
MTETEAVRSWTEGHVGVIELNRPDRFNCLSTPVLDGIQAALDRFTRDVTVRALLVRGAGRHFCTGADLAEVLERLEGDTFDLFVARGHVVLRNLECAELPVVVAVDGLALAGGLELVLAGDVVFAAASAKFGDQHARYGLVPGWGGTQRLPRIVGVRRALDLMFSARWIDASEARDWGLVNYVVADGALHAEALAYCEKLARRSRPGLACMKRLAYDGLDATLADGLAHEARSVIVAMQSADVAEGLTAFQEQREPAFR